MALIKRKFRSKSVKRRTTGTKRRRLSFRPTRRGLMGRTVHAYRRYGTPSTVTMTGTANESDNSDTFALSNVVGYTELTNLYDQYKIKSVTMKFHLISNPDRLTTPGTDPASNYLSPPNYPKLWYYRDYDDSSALTLAQMREVGKAKFKILKPNSVVSITVRPAVLTQLYRSAVLTGYSPTWVKRIDCSQSDIPHYGIKWIMESDGVNLFTNSQYLLRIEYVYDLTMFNSR